MTNDELDNPPRRPWEGGDTSAPYGVWELKRELAEARARVAALEAERAKLEHERDQWRSAHNGQKAQVTMIVEDLAASRARIDQLEEEWQSAVDGENRLRARVAALEAELAANKETIAGLAALVPHEPLEGSGLVKFARSGQGVKWEPLASPRLEDSPEA